MNEVFLAYEFLLSEITSDSILTSLITGGFWRNIAPLDTSPPYGLLSMQSGSDVLTMNGVRIMDSLLMNVRVYGPVSLFDTVLLPAANEIDTLLKRTNGVIFTTDNLGAILACFREQPIELSEEVNGDIWDTIGGLYRIQLQQIQ